MKEYKSAFESYRKANCFPKVIELAKKIGISDIKKIEEEWDIYLYKQKDYENAIIHFAEAEEREKELKALIKANKFEKAIELLNQFPNMNQKFYLYFGKYFEKKMN